MTRALFSAAALVPLLVACDASCSVEDNGDGTATIVCPDGSEATVQAESVVGSEDDTDDTEDTDDGSGGSGGDWWFIDPTDSECSVYTESEQYWWQVGPGLVVDDPGSSAIHVMGLLHEDGEDGRPLLRMRLLALDDGEVLATTEDYNPGSSDGGEYSFQLVLEEPEPFHAVLELTGGESRSQACSILAQEL